MSMFKETDQIRCPYAGEWFNDGKGPIQARFDFQALKFRILIPKTREELISEGLLIVVEDEENHVTK